MQMAIQLLMDNENVVHLDKEILFNSLKNEVIIL